jgi:hypothetical protein
MNRNYIRIIIYCCLISTGATQDVEFSGYGATGIVIYDRDVLSQYNQETYYEGKLQADIEFSDHIEAQLDIRGNSTDNSMNFREFSVKFKYAEKIRFKFGHIKRPFGYEQMLNHDELYTVERSVLQNTLSDLGYGGRTVSFIAYYNYSKKRPEFPYSYNVSLFKDNSLSSGIALRGLYHFNDYAVGFNYLYQSRSGWRKINVQGIGLEFVIDQNQLFADAELVYVQDPIQGLQILEQQKTRRDAGLPPLNDDEFVYTIGAKLITAYKFLVDGEVVNSIEPVILLGYYQPDSEISNRHVVQGVLGGNVYFHKKVSASINADLRLTRNEFNSEYTTDDSRFTLELQARF